jgi:hypothetical protein
MRAWRFTLVPLAFVAGAFVIALLSAIVTTAR